MSFHGMDKLVLCSTCSKSKFGIDSVDLKEVPVSLSPWRAGTIVTDLSKAVFSLHCFERECNNRHLRDFFRDHPDQFNVPCYPVDKTPATRCIRIVYNNGERF